MQYEISKEVISDLNIRTGPGVDHSRVQFCPPGVYTIMAVSEGADASMWGKAEKRDRLVEPGFLQEIITE